MNAVLVVILANVVNAAKIFAIVLETVVKLAVIDLAIAVKPVVHVIANAAILAYSVAANAGAVNAVNVVLLIFSVFAIKNHLHILLRFY
jgi:hypothetical protein